MKSLIHLFIFLISCSISSQAQDVLVFEGKNIQASKVNILRFDFQERKYQEFKTLEVETSSSFHFTDQFIEPTFYQIKIDDQKAIRVAVEKAGKLLFSFEEKLILKSNAAKIADFGTTIGALNEHYFASLKKEYEEAVEKKDMARLEVLEKQKDDLLIQFVGSMEKAVRDMGPSAQAYQALGYFDSHKNFDFLKEMAESFERKLPKAHLTQFLRQRVDAAAQVQKGAKAPHFTTKNLEGKKIELSDYTGSYVLVDFWASWCLACRAENPKLVELYAKLQSKGFEILSISRDEEEEAYQKALAKDELTWTQVWDRDGSLAKLYLVSSLPANFLLDPKGKIMAKNVTADQLDAILKEVF